MRAPALAVLSRRLAPTAAALVLAGCSGPVHRPEPAATAPSHSDFPVCHGHGCRERARVSLSPAQWERVTAPLRPAPPGPAAERERLAAALGRMEAVVGRHTATSHDRARTFQGFGRQGQMDCTDEATNTATYLALFRAAGLVRHHNLGGRATRGWFVFGWPHVSTTIQERASATLYAVDSWFHPNGHPAEVVPLEAWKGGWEPADSEPQPPPRPWPPTTGHSL